MRADLETIIKGLQKTKRKLQLTEDKRPSKFYLSEDSELSNIFSREPVVSNAQSLGKDLASRYGDQEKTVYLGEVGTTKCNHILADPDFENNTFKFRVKYGQVPEVWKNVLFSKFLNSQKELGWCLSRDWPADSIENPFYIVMLQGKIPLLQALVADVEHSKETMGAAINFMGDYFFGDRERKEHMKEDKDRSVIKSHVDLIIEGMKRTIPFSDLNPEDWLKKLKSVRAIIYKNIDFIEDRLYYCRVASDCIPENIVLINGEYNKGDLSNKLAWIDQGYRKELLNGWLKRRGIENPYENDYFRAFNGTPHFNLGHFYFALQLADKVPEVCKQLFRNAVENFVYDGRFGRRLGQEQDSEIRVKFTNWGPQTRQLAANLFALGELRAAVYNIHLGQKTTEMQNLARILIEDIIPAGNIYTFVPATNVKNYNQ